MTILQWIAFSNLMDDFGLQDALEANRLFYVSVGLSFLYLPLPRKLICCLETEMYIMRESDVADERDPNLKKKTTSADGENTDDEDGGGAAKKASKDDDLVMPHVDWDKETRPALMDSFVFFKLVFVVFIYLFWICSIVMTIVLTDYAGKTGEEPGIRTFVELDPDDAVTFVICWYLCLIWGILLNLLRVVIISLLAPIKAKDLFDRQNEIFDEGEKNKEYKKLGRQLNSFRGFFGQCSCVTMCCIPAESV